jgi:glutamyl-tRNA reductase
MIVCLSASYKNANLPMLESLNFQDKSKLTQTLCSENNVKECALIQTCHRVEIYCVLDSEKEGTINQIQRLWSTKTGVSLDIIKKTLNIYFGKDALLHLFNLSSGLESMVIGEDQILGQIRESYLEAKKNGTLSLVLSRVFMKAINVGRRVRTETRINEGSVSISSAAVDLAARELGDLTYAKALVIGAGEAGSLAAETLKRRGAATILIANRTHEKAVELAKKVSGKAIRFNRIFTAIPKLDLVIGAVSVTQPILKERHIASALSNAASSKKILLIDISQPRAFDEKIASYDGICLKTICDLEEIVNDNLRARQSEAEKSRKIISEELTRFELDLSKLLAQPLIIEMCRKFESIRQKEFSRAVQKLGESDERKLLVLERFSRELIERIAQIPIEQLRKAALNGDGELLSAAEQLFQTEGQ